MFHFLKSSLFKKSLVIFHETRIDTLKILKKLRGVQLFNSRALFLLCKSPFFSPLPFRNYVNKHILFFPTSHIDFGGSDVCVVMVTSNRSFTIHSLHSHIFTTAEKHALFPSIDALPQKPLMALSLSRNLSIIFSPFDIVPSDALVSPFIFSNHKYCFRH